MKALFSQGPGQSRNATRTVMSSDLTSFPIHRLKLLEAIALAASLASLWRRAMSTAFWDDMNSEHLKRFSEMVAIIDSGKNADRKKKLKEKHKFRLQDFAAFPKARTTLPFRFRSSNRRTDRSG